jgi:hypothetical protein
MGTDQLNMACLHLARKGRKQSAVVVELVSTYRGRLDFLARAGGQIEDQGTTSSCMHSHAYQRVVFDGN